MQKMLTEVGIYPWTAQVLAERLASEPWWRGTFDGGTSGVVRVLQGRYTVAFTLEDPR